MSLKSISIMPEWARQDAMWVGWPCVPEYWGAHFEGACEEIAAFVRVLAPRITVHLGVRTEKDAVAARKACGQNCEIHVLPMGDVWFRDIGPIFAPVDGVLRGLQFQLNGWGGKYPMDGDAEAGTAILKLTGHAALAHDFVLEGGAVDFDGAGRLITTRACLLNPNRNIWTELEAETALKTAFGVTEIIWLDDGLIGDHTDGHVDNVARFIGNGRIAIQTQSGQNDPNTAVYKALKHQIDATHLDMINISSPGEVLNSDGELMPASHLNFVFANGLVIMPRYEAIYSDQARIALAAALPDHEIVALDSTHILTGGGSFHCISQQVPRMASAKLEALS